MYYFGARYYDPLTGRFTTRDTYPGRRVDPQSQNKYAYCLNNPHKYNDPTGNIADPVSLTAVGITLYGAYMVVMNLEQLFTLANNLVGMISTAPPSTQSPAETIESLRDQAWNNYGAYQGTSNPTTVTEQAQNNGLVFQDDSQEEKIHEGQQAKHDTSHANYRLAKKNGQYKSPVFDPNTQPLLDSGKGTGVLKTGTPPVPGSSEYVKWKEWIGLAVPPGGGQSIFTMWGKIHYGSRGHHIVPGPPLP